MSLCEDPKGHTHGTELRTMEEELGVLTFRKHTPCARHLSDSITLNLALITQSIKHCPPELREGRSPGQEHTACKFSENTPHLVLLLRTAGSRAGLSKERPWDFRAS